MMASVQAKVLISCIHSEKHCQEWVKAVFQRFRKGAILKLKENFQESNYVAVHYFPILQLFSR